MRTRFWMRKDSSHVQNAPLESVYPVPSAQRAKGETLRSNTALVYSRQQRCCFAACRSGRSAFSVNSRDPPHSLHYGDPPRVPFPITSDDLIRAFTTCLNGNETMDGPSPGLFRAARAFSPARCALWIPFASSACGTRRRDAHSGAFRD